VARVSLSVGPAPYTNLDTAVPKSFADGTCFHPGRAFSAPVPPLSHGGETATLGVVSIDSKVSDELACWRHCTCSGAVKSKKPSKLRYSTIVVVGVVGLCNKRKPKRLRAGQWWTTPTEDPVAFQHPAPYFSRSSSFFCVVVWVKVFLVVWWLGPGC